MRTIDSLDEKKQIAYDILKKVDAFCKAHNIQYFLGYGTLLGAIRHGGYIPWDDDIDLWMKREDYEVFIKAFEIECEQCNLAINSYRTTENYNKTFVQIYDKDTKIIESKYNNTYCLGLFIDIFPLDGLPDNRILSSIHLKKLQILKLILICNRIDSSKKEHSFIKKSFIKSVFLLFHRINTKILLKYEGLEKKYAVEACSYIHTSFAGHKGYDLVLDKSYFDNVCSMEFELNEFPIPVKYDEILKQLYGDYMKLPPLEKRITQHEYEAYYVK